MFGGKRFFQLCVAVLMVGCLIGGALAKGGGGGGHGGGGGGHGGGGHGGGGWGGGGGGHASAMHSGGGRSSGMHSSGMSSAMARSSRGPSSGQSSFRSADIGSNRHGDGGQQASFRSGDRGSQFSRQGDGPHNANYDRVMAFMNGGGDRGDHRDNVLGNSWGDGRGDNRGWDRGNWGRDGNRSGQFSSSDHRFGHNGANFNHDDFRHNADSIRHDFHDRHDVPFRTGWWDHRHFNHGFGPWGWNWWWGRPWFWWGWATAPYLDSWLGFGWSQPCYWDYGPGGYVTYNYGTNQFYQQDQLPVPANEYYSQVYDLAHSAVPANAGTATQGDWLPLGVFALTKPGRQDENWMVQLGVNKQGVLSGTYYNQEKDVARPLVGMVDKKTHKASWYFADGTEGPMVFETSVDNLTEPQSTVMVHFGPGDNGVWQMVRLERPEAAENQGQPAQTEKEPLPLPPQHELP